MAGDRILVVEDDPDNLTLIVDVLHSLGYEVLQAVDGEQCLKVATAEHPDLILMDLSLPRVDGWMATGEIKAARALSDIPIIAMTAHSMVGDRERALAAGCDDYIAKPVNLRELAQKLQRFLNT